MTIVQYAQEVKRMRDLQTRSSIVLGGAKSQEKRVDDITNEILLAQ